MTLSIKSQEDYLLYGKQLDGLESDLDKARLARINFLKQKMRAMLTVEIGDTPDNIADTVRAIILGEAIRLGMVTDSGTIAKHAQYIKALLNGYGGGECIANVLLGNLTPIYNQIVLGYFVAKSNILAAQTAAEVSMIDIDPSVDDDDQPGGP